MSITEHVHNLATNSDGENRLTTPVILSVVAFAGLVVAILGGLVFEGRDISALVDATTRIIPVTIGVVVLSSQVRGAKKVAENNNELLDQVSGQVNGKLDAQLESINGRLDTHSDVLDIVLKRLPPVPSEAAKPEV